MKSHLDLRGLLAHPDRSDTANAAPAIETGLTDTEYLLSSLANAAHLARSIEQLRRGDMHEQSQGEIQSQVQKRDLVDEG
jgi:hypothetical protein